MKIAQRFIAGELSVIKNKSPVGTTDLLADPSAVPTGLEISFRLPPSDKSLDYYRTSLRDFSNGFWGRDDEAQCQS